MPLLRHARPRRFVPSVAWLVLVAGLDASCARAPSPVPAPVPRSPAASPAPTRETESPAPAPPSSRPLEVSPAAPPLITVGLIWDVDTLSLAPVGTGMMGGAGRGPLERGERLAVRVTRQGAVARIAGGR